MYISSKNNYICKEHKSYLIPLIKIQILSTAITHLQIIFYTNIIKRKKLLHLWNSISFVLHQCSTKYRSGMCFGIVILKFGLINSNFHEGRSCFAGVPTQKLAGLSADRHVVVLTLMNFFLLWTLVLEISQLLHIFHNI